jgi:hypothetical protein
MPGTMRRVFMTVPLDVPDLPGSLVRLEKLAVRHAAELAGAAADERDGEMIPFASLRAPGRRHVRLRSYSGYHGE